MSGKPATTDWNKLYDELEIQGLRRRKRMPTSTTFKEFEAGTAIILPQSYKVFAELFGAGELAGYYRFTVPLGRADEYDLATFNKLCHGSPEDNMWTDYAGPEVIKNLLFFASTIGGEVFAWQTNEASDVQNSDYAIYRFRRSPKRLQVAKSFEGFVNKCLSGKLDTFEELPGRTYLKF